MAPNRLPWKNPDILICMCAQVLKICRRSAVKGFADLCDKHAQDARANMEIALTKNP